MNLLSQVDTGSKFLGAPTQAGALGRLSGVGQIVSVFIQGSLVLASVILFFYLIFGGIGIISGSGSNDPQKIEQGKKAATSALIGFVVVFLAYWIVKLIGQLFRIDNFI